ncbi:hypothetical protein BG011_005851 [Mortierella polycephala]|uniref:Uncharacterized protein n=1 Tax=Mortierella polycephala TaxID=41804 RepID=A0A9P6QEQ5_9FUNG|nr:hypothetical protein BG011_005851 [Mortierella polycephala]
MLTETMTSKEHDQAYHEYRSSGFLDALTTNQDLLSKDTENSRPVSSLSFRSGRKTGWNDLPPEIIEVVLDILDDDTFALAALVQVERQLFFMAVPRLYRDPFQRIQAVSHLKCNSMRLSVPDDPAPSYLLSDPQTLGEAIPSVNPKQEEEEKEETKYTVARFDEDMKFCDAVLKSQLQTRELNLLITMLSPLIQQLCVRFPALKERFDPSPSGSPHRWDGKDPLDFGPHFETVSWTSEYYLRHWIILDLEKLYTRGRRRSGPRYMSNISHSHATTGKDCVFQRQFSTRWTDFKSMVIGAPEYLQRALLNQPGAGRIRTLRVPMNRLRTYQQRHERAPRPDKTTPRNVSGREQRAEEQPVPKEEEVQQADDNNVSAVTMGNDTGDRDQEQHANNNTLDESSRPYCFTWDKVTNLRRFEVSGVTENPCDWETLDRVLATLQLGDYRGIKGESHKNGRQFDTIREFSLQTQSSLLDGRFVKILSYFDQLEVLELQYNSYQQQPWVSRLDSKICTSLKALRMGTTRKFTADLESYEDLGRFRNLEELRVTVMSAHPFQWVVDAIKETRLRHQKSIIKSAGQLGYGNIKEDDALSLCLPKLLKLTLSGMHRATIMAVNNAIEAFGDQLQEFIIYIPNISEPIRFEYPFSRLTRLAIRGDGLLRFDMSSLAKHCPTIELLALQHTCYCRAHLEDVDHRVMVDALVQLPKLRCLYFEGLWHMEDKEFLDLATTSSSLYKIAIHNFQNVTQETMNRVDKILRMRDSRYPLRPKGVFRLPRTMSDFLAKDYHWRVSYFGHDDD